MTIVYLKEHNDADETKAGVEQEGRQPSDIPAFNTKVIELFSEHASAHA